MNNLEEKLLKVKNQILELEETKEFLKNKKLLDDSKELRELRLRLAKEPGIAEILKEYNSNPLVVNYSESRENLLEILRVVKDILSD